MRLFLLMAKLGQEKLTLWKGILTKPINQVTEVMLKLLSSIPTHRTLELHNDQFKSFGIRSSINEQKRESILLFMYHFCKSTMRRSMIF